MTKQIILATTNTGKAAEFAVLLAELGVSVQTLRDYPALGEITEDGDSFAANALIKARTVAQATGMLTIADDSGLEVDALGGAPGIYSARYAGLERDDEKNIDKLLLALRDVPEEERGAQFCCAIAIVTPDGREQLTQGVCCGRIAQSRAGEGGFGYDPVFIVPEYGKTFAQLSMAEKNAISHRGQANRQAVLLLRALLGGESHENSAH